MILLSDVEAANLRDAEFAEFITYYNLGICISVVISNAGQSAVDLSKKG